MGTNISDIDKSDCIVGPSFYKSTECIPSSPSSISGVGPTSITKVEGGIKDLSSFSKKASSSPPSTDVFCEIAAYSPPPSTPSHLYNYTYDKNSKIGNQKRGLPFGNRNPFWGCSHWLPIFRSYYLNFTIL